jgi:anti-anti-sigma factor
MPSMKVQKAPHGDTMLITLNGEFDSFVTNPFSAEIKTVLDQGVSKIVLNMEQVGFVNSTAMGAMIRARNLCKESGGDLVVSAANTAVKEAMESLGLDRLFSIHADDDAAIGSFGQSAAVELSGESESTVMIHPPGQTRPLVARLRKLDADQLECRLPNPSAELVHGREMRLKFRLPLYRKEWFELKARIEQVGAEGDQTVVSMRLTEVSEVDQADIQRFVDDMNALRDEIGGA